MTDIKYSQKFFSKQFGGSTKKDAYLKACKWYATNVLSKDELHNVQVEFVKDEQFPTVTIHLYAVLTEDEIQAEHCRICKEFNSLFYIRQATDCAKCTMQGYCNRQKQKMAVKVAYYKKCLNRRLNDDQDL